MEFKNGLGWKACYDAERELYTAERSWRGYYQLCEITKEIYDVLGTDAMGDESAGKWISKGRELFQSDDDYYTLPYVKKKKPQGRNGRKSWRNWRPSSRPYWMRTERPWCFATSAAI